MPKAVIISQENNLMDKLDMNEINKNANLQNSLNRGINDANKKKGNFV